MGFFSEFRAFAMRGNIVDMASGIVIGAAFGKIVSSLVNNVIMPPVGLAIGGVEFSKLKWVLKAAGADGKGGVTIDYGIFINTVISFVIIAFAIFCLIRVMNRMLRKQEAEAPPPPAPPAEVALLTEIRDLLKRDAH
ncbi:MAG TPA: large-conductance mechanosensitive channel protein MscL [Rhodanobacteraceae bacterium]|nr:large-conductance mechanosensitive channel protein MscL [Rhodanobacteraceae bacterium]